MMNSTRFLESNNVNKIRVPVRPWNKFIKPENMALCNEDAIDLLSKMLLYDHAERILPK
jgi:hypothetical protein